MKVRRAIGLTFHLQDRPRVDIAQLLRGQVSLSRETDLFAASLLTESVHRIEKSDVDLLARLSDTEWMELSDLAQQGAIGKDVMLSLAERGLVVTDADDEELRRLSRKDQRLRAVPWNGYGRLYHTLTKWSEQFLAEADEGWRQAAAPRSFEAIEERFGEAPPPAPAIVGDTSGMELPRAEQSAPLFDVLMRRRTTRAFDRRKKLSLDDFSTVMSYAFGCHGFKKMSRTLTVLKKTSPSGGALHPIDIYPLVIRVRDVEAGIYRYDATRHSLIALRGMSSGDAESAALRLAADQIGFSHAHVIFILVARFGRHFWKYRYHFKGYKVLCMEAGHLSQTLYLVATELGLGAFVSAAIDDRFAESLTGIDDVSEGVIGICGCGIPRRRDPEGFDYVPFVANRRGIS